MTGNVAVGNFIQHLRKHFQPGIVAVHIVPDGITNIIHNGLLLNQLMSRKEHTMYKISVACDLIVSLLTIGSEIPASIVEQGLPTNKDLELSGAIIVGQYPHQTLVLKFQEAKDEKLLDVVILQKDKLK